MKKLEKMKLNKKNSNQLRKKLLSLIFALFLILNNVQKGEAIDTYSVRPFLNPFC